jgi:hypothetical protein
MIGQLSWNSAIRAATGAALLAAASVFFLGAGYLVSTAPFLVGLLLISVVLIPLAVSPTLTLVLFIGLAFFANYFSSWLPAAGAYPSGAVVRDILGVLFVCFALFFLAVRDERGSAARPRVRGILSTGERKAFFLLALIFLIWVAAAIANGDNPFMALYASKNLILYVAVAAAAFAMLERGHLNGRAIGLAILVYGLMAALLGILDSLTNGRILDLLGYNPNYAGISNLLIIGEDAPFLGYDRASGGTTNAVGFGYLMALLAVYAGYRWVTNTSRHSFTAWLELTVLSAATVACILSLTRGAFLALAAGMLILLIVSPTRPRAVLLVLGIAVLVVGLGYAGYQEVLTTRITAADAASQRSSEIRIEQFWDGVRTLEANLFGTGLGTEGFAASRFGIDERIVWDQFFLVVALQVGIPGALAVVAMLGVLLRAALRSIRREGTLLACLLVVFLFSAMLSSQADNPVYAVPVWLLIALAAARADSVRHPASAPTSGPAESAGRPFGVLPRT